MKALKLAFSIAVVLLFTACNKDNEEDASDKVVRFSSNIITVKREESPRTRAKFDVDTEFKILVRDNNTTSPFAQLSLNGVAQATTGEYNDLQVTPLLYWDEVKGKNADLKLIGISPRSAAPATGDAISWTLTDQVTKTDLEALDLISAVKASYTYNDRAEAAKLDFNHTMTKITIILKGLNDGYSVADLNTAVVAYNVAGSAILNITNGTYSGHGAKKDVAPMKADIIENVNGNNETTGYSFTILAFPFSADDKVATITIDGNVYNVNIPKISGNSAKLEAGVHNTYNVQIRKSGVDIKAGVADWNAQTGVDTESRLVELGTFQIDGTAESVITPGSKITMKITDSNPSDKTAVFEYKEVGGTNKWVATTPVYWDDIKQPITKIDALLYLGTTTLDDGDRYFSGSATGSWNIQSEIDLGTSLNPFFTHPLSKITVIVKTTDDDTKVNIVNGIQSIVIPGCGTFKVGTDGVAIVQDGTADVPFNVATGSYDNTKKEYTCKPLFITGQSLSTLCKVTIKENASYSYNNVYEVKLDPAQTLSPGKHYTYTIRIQKTGVAVTGTLEDWEPVDNGEIPTEL